MLRMGKVDVDSIVEVQPKKELDLLKMIDQIAQESISDIANSFYGNGTMIDHQADKALRRIEGRMQSLKAMARFMI